MGLSEEATQMVRGGFEPETFRSQARHLAIVATPRRPLPYIYGKVIYIGAMPMSIFDDNLNNISLITAVSFVYLCLW